MEQPQKEHPDATVELWAIDEHRIGLKPLLRRVWVRKGSRPSVHVQQRYEWMYLYVGYNQKRLFLTLIMYTLSSIPIFFQEKRARLYIIYGFVHPQSGHTEWLILPTVDIETMNLALVQFTHAVGASPEKQIALVMDQAGWHASSHVQIPEGLHLLFLPPYSPELQPSERLWPLSNEGIASRYFSSLDALEEAQIQRCQILLQRREIIRCTTCFHWWPPDPSNHM